MAADIGEWLEGLGLGKYAEAFAENAVDLDVLAKLDADDLKEIGIPLGDRKRFLAAIGEPATPTAGATAPTPPPAQAEAERRQLTVMFVDLVGSTAIAEKLDPEDFRTVIRRYQESCAAVVGRFEGYVAKFLGDGILIYFGYPQAHENDAERAVLAGLEIVETMPRIESDQALRARIGIATGLVVAGDMVGDGVAEKRAVLGETPNLAARLEALAEPNTVVIAPATHRLTGGAFDYADLGNHELKGFSEPVRAWRVTGERVTEGRFEAAHGTGLTELVGREPEIALLEDRWRQAKAGAGQVVLLSGEAGVGKSRITQVLRERISEEPHTRLRYQCSPYYTNSAAHPIITQLGRVAGFERGDDGDAKLDKLEALIARSATDVGRVAPLFAALLALPVDRYPSLNFSPERQRQETLSAFADQVAALSDKQPVLLIFEDAHWIDPTSLGALGAVIDRIPSAAVLALITYRPEFEPPWADRGHVTVHTVTRLSPDEGADMVAKVTGGKTLPPEVLDQIVAKTDGVPLFVEELTKTVLEAGFLTERENRYVLDGPLPSLSIPATLQDSLMARLDRLSPVKEVAQIGACIGREFSYELLAAASPLRDNELQDSLTQLVNSELILRHGTPPTANYTFKHALVQDAAYESLLKSKRRQLHTTIARALEERFGDRLATEPEVAARHYTSAGLNKQAIPYWLAAGQQSVARFANQEASAHLRSGLELLETLPENRDRDEQELAFRTTLGFALISYKSYGTEECGQTFARAWELCERVGDTPQILPVLLWMSVFYLVKGDYPKSRELVDQCLSVAEKSENTGGLIGGHTNKSSILLFLGEATLAREQAEAALALYDRTEHQSLANLYGQDLGIMSADWASWALWLLGYPDQAMSTSREGLALAKDLEHPLTLATSLAHRAVLDWMRRDVEATRIHAEAAIEISETVGIPFRYIEGLMLQGWADAEQGEVEKGISQIRQGVDSWRAIEAKVALPCWLTLLAEAHRRNGQVDEAISVLGEAFDTIEQIDERIWEPELHRLMGLFLLDRSAPDEDQAETCFEKAIQFAQAQSTRSFELRAATSLARLWQSQGKPRAARDLLFPVYDWFTEGFDTPDLKDANALLDELG